jgi:hypothetical protein
MHETCQSKYTTDSNATGRHEVKCIKPLGHKKNHIFVYKNNEKVVW